MGTLMKPHVRYLWYILYHKWLVFWECVRLGIPWLGVVHDLSKFSKAEWRPYVLSFYSGWRKDERPQWVVRFFERALEHHLGHNKHHWEHWLSKVDGRRIPAFAVEMPDRYRKEMLADWIGVSTAKKKSNPHYEGISLAAGWYRKNKDMIYLHPETRAWIEKQLGIEDED